MIRRPPNHTPDTKSIYVHGYHNKQTPCCEKTHPKGSIHSMLLSVFLIWPL